jgi:uncharacterized phage-associated protein
MNNLEDRISSSVHTILYILEKIGGKGDFHKIFKVMYFADQKHLTRYGSLITEDQYIAMKNGPVPSMAYDILKALRGQGLHSNDREKFNQYFKLIDNYNIESKIKPDHDELSDAAIKCLDESIIENQDFDFDKLTDKSHDSAWEVTTRDCEIQIVEIAKAGGANDALLNYINNSLENKYSTFA